VFLFFAQCPRHGSSFQWCFITRWFIHRSMVFVHHSMVFFVHHSMVTSSNGVFFIIQWLHHPIVFFHRSLVFFHHPMVLPSSSNRSSSLSPFSLSPTFPPPPPPSSSSAARRRRRHQHQRSQPNVQNHQRQICGGGTRAFQNGQEASLGGSA
jgi:hypothetical protein